jgi:hypothetical protein
MASRLFGLQKSLFDWDFITINCEKSIEEKCFKHNRDGYTYAKTEFIKNVMEKVKEI